MSDVSTKSDKATMSSAHPQIISRKMSKFFLRNTKYLDLYFSKQYSLDNINQAIKDFKKNLVIKPILNI